MAARLLLSVALVASLLLASTDAHAVLTNPRPWNTNPSKTSPCGGGTKTAATATFQRNTATTVKWQVIAGDGTGHVTFKLNKKGEATFTDGADVITLASTGADPAAVGSFTFQVTVPAGTQCTGTDGTCTLYAAAEGSKWYSCATIALSDTAPTQGPTTDPAPCITPTGLSFCSDLNGEEVAPLEAGKLAKDLDAELKATYESYLANPNVFSTPNNNGCGDAYKKFLCASNFHRCRSTVENETCKERCTSTNLFCGITESHIGLYQCSDYDNITKDIYGTCSSAGTLRVTMAVALIVAAALALVL